MDIGLSTTLLAGDPRLVDHIVGQVKSQGIFDQFRKECIADVDTKVQTKHFLIHLIVFITFLVFLFFP